MDKNSISILKISISTILENEILEDTRKWLGKNEKRKAEGVKKAENSFIILTPNPEIINYALKDENFRQIVNSAQINIPDGWGIVWAAKKLLDIKIERISGVDLMLDLCKMASSRGFRIGLIGGKGGVAVSALECLQESYPNLKGWAMDGPEIRIMNYELRSMNKLENSKLKNEKETIEKIVEKIQNERTDILFVGLGFPKQEYFIENVKCQMSNVKSGKPLVMMAVGGSFDYISGRIPRAPKWMRDNGWEWLFRLIREPWRLPRMLRGAEFFWRVISSF